MQNIFLMMKDIPVMRINTNEGIYRVLREDLLPFDLRGKIRTYPFPDKETYSKYEVNQMRVIDKHNFEAFISFLSHRILPLSRENAKKVYNLLSLNQLQDEISKAKIALICKAVSLQDNYWIKDEDAVFGWNNVNLRKVHLNEIIAQVALHGNSFTLTGDIHTPELTGQGAYAKAWFREEDGLYLYKKGANGNWESRIEVMVSNLLDKMNVVHLKYELGESEDVQLKEKHIICKCRCMTDDDISILSGMDFTSWCNVQGIDPYRKALEIDAESIYKMWIVDYLISNRDRHDLNWGFFYDCNTGEILCCHPLYDHNNAFDAAFMQDKNAPYLYDNRMTMREAAKQAMNHVDFHFTEEITREDFLTDRQYESFTDRADELGIRLVREETRKEADPEPEHEI